MNSIEACAKRTPELHPKKVIKIMEFQLCKLWYLGMIDKHLYLLHGQKHKPIICTGICHTNFHSSFVYK